MSVEVWGQPEEKAHVWDLREIKAVWNWACDHRDHSPVSFAPAFLPFPLWKTGYWCFLSTTVFIDLFSVLNRWAIPKMPFSNVLPQEVGSLKCNTFWDAGAHKLPLEFCVWPLQLTFWAGIQKIWVFIVSSVSSSSDCWLLWWGLKIIYFALHFHIPEQWQVRGCFGSLESNFSNVSSVIWQGTSHIPRKWPGRG